ncbi:MAG: hypothetical protein ACK5O2_00980 [Microthrixaceae bacterium]
MPRTGALSAQRQGVEPTELLIRIAETFGVSPDYLAFANRDNTDHAGIAGIAGIADRDSSINSKLSTNSPTPTGPS